VTDDAQYPLAQPDDAPAPSAAEAGIVPAPDPVERRLAPAVVWLWRAGLATRTATWAIGVTVFGAFAPWNLPWTAIVAGIVVLGGVLGLFWPPAQYRGWSFRMRERDLWVRFGVLWRTVSVIPYSRIQHVDTRHGPVERWLGLSSVIIYTAGVRGADVAIPGLAADEAEALREQLARLGGGEDAV
jgi:uncharacterized protein